jgi:hypothetical protein
MSYVGFWMAQKENEFFGHNSLHILPQGIKHRIKWKNSEKIFGRVVFRA